MSDHGMHEDGALWLRTSTGRIISEVSHGWTADGRPRARYLRDKAGNEWHTRDDAPPDVREAWLSVFAAWPGEPALEMARDPALLDAEWRGAVGDIYTAERNRARAERLRAARAAT